MQSWGGISDKKNNKYNFIETKKKMHSLIKINFHERLQKFCARKLNFNKSKIQVTNNPMNNSNNSKHFVIQH